MFNLDNPINTIKEDENGLNRANFAENLAKNIDNHFNMGINECLVVGLMGEWGDGKTSVLNLTKTYLKDSNIDVVEFNPWLYSSYNQLIQLFFENLIDTVTDNNLKGYLRKYSLKINKLSLTKTVLSQTIGIFSDHVENVFDELFPKDSEELSLNNLKDNINCELKNHKILCIIDDMDRLTKDEISEMFRLLKIVANFNNVVYLVAFDREIVSDALEDIHNDGGKYIEKIINVPLELSSITTEELKTFFLKRIDKTVNEYQIINYNKSRLNNYLDFYDAESLRSCGIIYLFNNLRDITRFFNILNFNIDLIKNEVNFEDFVVITAIEIFRPKIYKFIKNNEFLFINYNDNDFLREEQNEIMIDKDKESFEKIIKEDFNLKAILSKLFPKIHHLYNSRYTLKSISNNEDSNIYISHPYHFKSYFKLNDNIKLVSEHEITIVTDLINENDRDHVILYFKKFDREDRLNEFFKLLKNRVDKISENSFPSFLNLLFTLKYDEFKTSIFLNYVEELIKGIIYRLKQSERFKILEKSFNESEDIILLSKILKNIENYNYNLINPDDRPLLSNNEITSLNEIIINKFKNFADKKTISTKINLPYILSIGKNLELNEENNKIINNYISTKKGLLIFLKYFLKDYINFDKDKDQLNRYMGNINKYIEIEQIYNKIESYDFEEEDWVYVNAFNEGYKLWKKDNN